MKKPRPFNHKLIYVDNRQERLKEIEQKARQELGMELQPSYSPAHLHGVFSAAQSHRRGGGQAWIVPVLLSMLLILLAVVFLVLFSND